MEMDAQHNAVAAVNEVWQQQGGKKPVYEYERKGEDHNPLFTATLKFGGLAVEGRPSSTRKAAKHSAALAWIQACHGNENADGQSHSSAHARGPLALTPAHVSPVAKLFLDVENRPKDLEPVRSFALRHGMQLHVFAAKKWPALKGAMHSYPEAIFHVTDSGVKSAADVRLIATVSLSLETCGHNTAHVVVGNDFIYYAFSDTVRHMWPESMFVHMVHFDKDTLQDALKRRRPYQYLV